jgi:hypothetical protein
MNSYLADNFAPTSDFRLATVLVLWYCKYYENFGLLVGRAAYHSPPSNI